MFKKFLLFLINLVIATDLRSWCVSFSLLLMRLGFGCAMLTHGVDKLMNFQKLQTEFPDPIGIGHGIPLVLVIFSEMFCSIAIIFGFLTRLSVIPLLITMAVAFFVVHAGDPFAKKELALLYMTVYAALFISGPGKFSLDQCFSRYIIQDKKK